MAEANELSDRFWRAFGGLLHGQPRAPQTAQEWIDAGTRLKALTQLDQLASRLEQAASVRHGAQSTLQNTKSSQRPERDSIYYDANGAACCPIHEKPLREGKYGYFCPCKDDTQPKGFCTFRTKTI